MSKSLLFWRLVWIGLVAYFGIFERRGLRSGLQYAPLSWHLRWVLGINSHKVHRIAGEVIFWMGIVWLRKHLYQRQQ